MIKFIKLLAPFFRSLNAYAPIRLRLFKIPKAPPPTTQPLPSGTPRKHEKKHLRFPLMQAKKSNSHPAR